MSDYLFSPRQGIEFLVRDEVQLLQVKYPIFRAALYKQLGDWLEGKCGICKVEEDWERKWIKEVNDAVNVNKEEDKEAESSDVFQKVFDEMVRIKVPGHFKVVTSHRKWLRISYDFLIIIGVKFSDNMNRLVRVHDLSKYTHREVLGYAVMFGDGSIDWRKLESEAEQIEWDTTLFNHYAGNPHHPEYFYPVKEDKSRDKSVPILELDPVNGKDYVDESLIDMMAARGERILATDATFNVNKWMDIPDRYMFRYADGDKAYAVKCFEEYKKLAKAFLSVEGNAEKLKGFFDIHGAPARNVVFEDYE